MTIYIELFPQDAEVEVSFTADCEVRSSPVPNQSMVIVPYNRAHYQLDEYRMKNGWPVSVPSVDVRAQPMISAEGEVITDRPHPLQIATAADVRWVAGETWDGISLRWYPTVGFPAWTWESSGSYAPTLVNGYRYRFHNELISRDALNFSSDTDEHLWSNFSDPHITATDFSLVLVLSMRSRYSAGADDPSYASIIAPGHPTPAMGPTGESVDGSTFALQLRGNTVFCSSNDAAFARMFSIAQLMETTAPVYLGLTVTETQLTVYMGTGSSNLQYETVETNSFQNTMDWVLGRATGSLAHGADMSLFELGVYHEPLSKEQMVSQIATLSAAYGGA